LSQNFAGDKPFISDCHLLESREPGSPSPALFSQGGEEDEMSPYKFNFITDMPNLLDANPTIDR